MVRNAHSPARGVRDNRRVLPIAAHILARAAERLSVVIARVASRLVAARWKAVLLPLSACRHWTCSWSDTARITSLSLPTLTALTLPALPLSGIACATSTLMMVVMMVMAALALTAARTIAARSVPEVRGLGNVDEVLH